MEQDAVDILLNQWRAERPDLDTSMLGIAIRVDMLAKLMRKDSAECLAEVGLKTSEYDVLSALRRQGTPFELTATELARVTLLTSGAMTTRIDNLEKRRLVRRSPDPDDRRGVRVRLTRKGLALVNKAIDARLDAAERGVGKLSRTDRAAAERALRKLMLASPATGDLA
jgi:DNA-binding MarR family transcriptional regulator